mgnify:CR=1 FL=1
MEDKYTVVRNIKILDINEDPDLDASSIRSTINTDIEVLYDNMIDMLQDKGFAKTTIGQLEYTATQIFAENLYDFLYAYFEYVLNIFDKIVGVDNGGYDYLLEYLHTIMQQVRESTVNISVDRCSIRLEADYTLMLDMTLLTDGGYDVSNLPVFESDEDEDDE